MSEIHRVTLTLNMENQEQKHAWQYISSIPKGRRTQYICSKIVQQEKKKEWENLICNVIKEALRDCDIKQHTEIQTKSDEAGELKDNILGYITSLQKEGG